MPEQLNSEIRDIADFVAYAMKIFGFDYEVELRHAPRKINRLRPPELGQ
jgi:threonyl-tRNA synthetase